MKREIIIAAFLVPLAFFSGRAMRTASGAQIEPSTASQRAAKSGDRPAPQKKQRPDSSVPHRWGNLRRQATMKPEALIEELLVSGSYGYDTNWLTEHLLATHPDQLFREFKSSGQDSSSLVRCWCLADPTRAIPLVLGKTEPFSTKLDPENYRPPVVFDALGWTDPALGMKTILELPEKQRHPVFFTSFLSGIAATTPSQTAAYFQQIESSGPLPAHHFGEILGTLAAVDPQHALAWEKSHPELRSGAAIEGMIDGLCKSDMEAAMGIYSELPDKRYARNAASSISRMLATKQEGLSSALDWLEANAAKSQLAEHKGNAISVWAFRHPDKVAGQILADPELLSDPRASELVLAAGRKEELIAQIDKLPPEAGSKLKELLGSNGMLPDATDNPITPDEILVQMRKSPENAQAEWEGLPEEERGNLISKLANQFNTSRDPALTLKLVSSSPSHMKGSGVQTSLGRLASMDPSAAAAFAEGIEDRSAREAALKAVHSRWMLDDEDAADAWLAETQKAR